MSVAAGSGIPQITVTKVRVVTHTMGPVIPDGQLSQNHWSIHLLTPDDGSIRRTWSGLPVPLTTKELSR